MDIIHIDIVEIWNLNDKASVSSPQSPYGLSSSQRSIVSVEHQIQERDVSRRQRLGWVDQRRVIRVSMSRGTEMGCPIIEIDSSDPIGSEDELAEWVDNTYHDR